MQVLNMPLFSHVCKYYGKLNTFLLIFTGIADLLVILFINIYFSERKRASVPEGVGVGGGEWGVVARRGQPPQGTQSARRGWIF